jgi:S1-C subfamily serine protease
MAPGDKARDAIAHARIPGPTGGRGANTDTDGRFAITGLAHGTVAVEVYDRAYTTADLERPSPRGGELDVGDIMILKHRRTRDAQKIGWLGLELSETRTITTIEPNSPAARAGFVVGDAVVAVDGLDVTAATGSVVFELTSAPIGTTIRVGLTRGVTIAAVTAE